MPKYLQGGVICTNDLTKEQQKLLTLMYKEVLSRQPALSFDDANFFTDSDELIRLFNLENDSDHISSLCWRLHEKGYISCEQGDDLASEISLSDKTIIFMENRFKSGIKDVLSFLAQFK